MKLPHFLAYMKDGKIDEECVAKDDAFFQVTPRWPEIQNSSYHTLPKIISSQVLWLGKVISLSGSILK